METRASWVKARDVKIIAELVAYSTEGDHALQQVDHLFQGKPRPRVLHAQANVRPVLDVGNGSVRFRANGRITGPR